MRQPGKWHTLNVNLTRSHQPNKKQPFSAKQHITHATHKLHLVPDGRFKTNQTPRVDFQYLSRAQFFFYNAAATVNKSHVIAGDLLQNKTFSSKKTT